MTILFIHGFNGSPNGAFFPALVQLCSEANVPIVVPAMPDPDHPQSNAWSATIKQTYDSINDTVILAGHSLGTRAALLFLEQYDVNVAGCLLVGAFANTVDNAERRNSSYGSFFDHQIDIALVKSRCPRFMVLHSEDDESIPYEQGVAIAHDLGAELATVQGRGHLRKPQDAPLIFDQLMRLANA